MKVGIVSDACLGFGSPQIIALAESLADALPAEVHLAEPDEPSTPAMHARFPHLTIHRLSTKKHVYEGGGRVEYARAAAALMDRLRPEVLVVVCTFSMPTLLFMKHRPRLTVFYSIESIIQYGTADVLLNQELRPKIDFIIWPEENRQARDSVRCGFEAIPQALVLNSANPRASADFIVPAASRRRRIIHQGTIGARQTYADWFLRPQIARLPIDVYGPLVDAPAQEMLNRRPGLLDDESGLIYHGRVDLERLARARRPSAYSVCIWSPDEERGRFAPSNKFFEAIADGVPPITAPHPQHVRLVEQYDCGLVMDDWSFEGLRKGLLQGLRLFGTPRYAELVANCQTAVRAELNREDQFGRIARELADRLRHTPAQSASRAAA